MLAFRDQFGNEWSAFTREERTPRHHGRWYLVFRSENGAGLELPVSEVRWQTRSTAERTLRTMSEFELRRRLRMAAVRAGLREYAGEWDGLPRALHRDA